MSRLFISHASANNAIALALGQWLESQGWSDYFLDVHTDRGIAPGERWMAALTGAVDRCEAVLFLVSPAWRDSKYCFAEFFEAKKLGKRIFGVIVEPIALSELPEQMTAEWQVCDLCHADEPVTFSVERPPLLPRTDVAFPKAGLDALARGLRKAGLDPATFEWPPAGEPDRSPYPGLRALDRADAAVFFGREAAIVRGIDQIRLTGERGVEPLFVILGASGAGKSSFLRAGLLPRLARDSDHFIVLPTLRCERAALSGPAGLWAVLRQALEQAGQPMSLAQVRELVAAQGLGRVLQRLRGGPEISGGATGAAHSTDARTLVVPIDQFEELFATDGQAESTELLQLITQALPAAGSAGSPVAGRLLLLATIRSDALPTLQSHPLLRELKPVLFSLPAMAPSNFKDVIEGPARRHSERHRLTIDPALTEALLADAQGPDALPLLALTLEWLLRDFGQRDGTELGLAQYETIGRVSGVIDRAVQRALAQPDHPPAIPRTPVEQDALLHRLFGFIATVDPDTRRPKRRVALRSDLRQALGAEGDALVSRLIEQRLLVADARSGDSGGPATETVEIAHEALLRQWGVMQRWLAEMAERLSAVESLRRSAADWLRGERDEALLVHTGHRLSSAQTLRRDTHLRHLLAKGDEEYLDTCSARDDLVANEWEIQRRRIAEQQAARTLWQRRFAWVLAIASLGVIGLLGWIVNQTREVSIQTSIVLSAAAERATDDGYFDRALRLAILAARDSWLYPHQPEVRGPLVRALAGNRQLGLYLHDAEVASATFSPNGQVFLTASADKTARLWDAHSGRALGYPMKHDKEVLCATFSQDGGRVLTASLDGTARLWDARTGSPLGAPMKHDDEVWSATFSPDGHRIVTGSEDGTARLWDGFTGRPFGKPMRHDGPVRSAVFSSDGSRIATASEDETALVWDANNGSALAEPFEHKDKVLSAVFSPDGLALLTASKDHTAQLWNIQTGRPIGPQLRHNGPVISAKFSPDGSRILTSSADNTAQIWETKTGQAIGASMKHVGAVLSATFSRDGQVVVTASADNTARLWDGQTGQPITAPMKHDGEVMSASFSKNGQQLLTASTDKSVRLWDTQTGRAIGRPMPHDYLVEYAVFSPNRKYVLSFSGKSARLWDAHSGQPFGKPMIHTKNIRSAAFSRDGQEILTASEEGSINVWNTMGGSGMGRIVFPDKDAEVIAFDKNGEWALVTSGNNTTSRLWDLRNMKAVGEPMVHEYSISFATIGNNGQKVLTASGGFAYIWESQTGQRLGSPLEHEGDINYATFDTESMAVVTASSDRTVRLWNSQTGAQIGSTMNHEKSVLSAEFSPDSLRIVSASDDRTVRVWDARTGLQLGASFRHDSGVLTAAFGPDDQTIFSGTRSGVARFWAAPRAQSNEPEKIVDTACKSTNRPSRLITERDLASSRILPHGFQVGDDVCKGLPAAATTVH